jgi:hypothetical protein
MVIAENRIGGPFDYIVTGERESQAAKELENRLDFLSRSYNLRREELIVEISDLRRRIEQKYNVKIGTTLDK